jgi:hypothetical protein
MQGPLRALEFEGAALRFPALELKLPNLRLPSCSKIHSNARMLIEAAHAPYVQQPAVALGAPIAIQHVPAPQQAPPQQAPPQQSPPHMPPSMPDCNAPRSPHCDAAMLDLQRQLRAREQQIEQLSLQMSRMAMSMEQLTQVIDRMAVASDATRAFANTTAGFQSEPLPQPAMHPVRAALVAPLPQQRPDANLIREPEIIRLSTYDDRRPAVSTEQMRSR